MTTLVRTTILLVDDDSIVRRGLGDIFRGTADLVVVGEAADGDEVVDAVRGLRPHVVLMDLGMRRVGGLEATRAVAALANPPAVIAMTALDTDGLVLRALEAGAVSFLGKDQPPEVFQRYVRSVAAGDAVFAPADLALVVAAGGVRTTPAGPGLDVLSTRELEVLAGLTRGRDNQEIASELYLGVTTVKTHVSSIYAKLGVPNRVLAAVAALRAGLVPL